MSVRGIFVGSGLNPGQGITDFGYCVEEVPDFSSPDGVEEVLKDMVGRDEAYSVEVYRVLDGKVHVNLGSASRRVVARFQGDVGKRRSGLRETFYHRTSDPSLPHCYEDRREASRRLSELAEYALNHGRTDGIEVEDVDWDNLLR